MQLKVYLIICVLAGIGLGYFMNGIGGFVIVFVLSILYTSLGLFIGYKLGIKQTSELMKERISQVSTAVAANSHAKKVSNAIKRSRNK